MQDALLNALLHETLEELSSPSSHGTLDTGPLLPYQLFSVALYHRYALRALVRAKLPAKPIKVSNVPMYVWFQFYVIFCLGHALFP